jgi:hypothetical protein
MTETSPVTVSITRHIDPAYEDEMVAWLESGFRLAEKFDGFLGAGWVRPTPNSESWHMLYRFDSPASLATWEASNQRSWWLGAAQGLVGESRLEKRTGIEGWFDEPTTYDVRDLRPAPKAPPRWKQMIVIFLVFYPLSLIANWTSGHSISDLWLPLRVLITTLAMTPVMTYLALPWVTRRMEWFLEGRPAPWRRASA